MGAFIQEFETAPKRPPSRQELDIVVLKAEFAKGIRDENQLTNAVFYNRHPVWKGKPLKNASAALKNEWVQLRAGVVRNFLKTVPPPAVAPGDGFTIAR